MELIEWANNFIDNLNSFRHDLEKKDIKVGEIDCIYKVKGQVKYIVEAELKHDVLQKISGSVVLVCLNTKENLAFVLTNWNEIIKNQKLKIIFSNPKVNQQWSILPHTHNMISDPKSLKLGLKSVFDTVPEV